MNASLLRDGFEHNTWATLRLLDACADLGQEQLQASAPGTYGSVIDTFRHIVGADAAYLFVLTGGEVPPIDDDDEARMGLADLRAATEHYAAAWSRLLEQDLDPERVVVRHRDDGSESRAPLGIRLAQVVHHGTDHRSQICTTLTTVGLEPPEIDVWAFAAAGGRLVQTQPTA